MDDKDNSIGQQITLKMPKLENNENELNTADNQSDEIESEDNIDDITIENSRKITDDKLSDCDCKLDGEKVECPDGGWGWACVLGCCIIHVLIGGYGRSYGMIYTQLIQMYHSSAAVTAWVNGSCSAIRMGFSPVSNALSRKYGARLVVTVGGLIMCLGSLLNAFSTSTEYFFFSYSTIYGIGGALVYSPSLVVIGEYFSKKRGIAMSLATSGSGLGAFIFPQIMIILFRKFGFNGGLLLLGALQANACISGLLYRPLKRRVPTLPSITLDLPSISKDTESTTSPGQDNDGFCEDNDTKASPSHSDQDKVKGDLSKQNDEECSRTSDDSTCKPTKMDIVEEKHEKTSGLCFNILSVFKIIGGFLDVSVWRDARFSLYAISQGLSVMSYLPVSTFIPAAAMEKGIDETGAAMILSSMALGDTIGRLCSGFFFDLPIIRKIRYIPFTSCLVICACLLLVWPHLSNVRLLMITTAIFGIIIGVTIAQRTNILCDLVGTSRLSGSHGMLVFAQGISVFFGPLIGGKLRDLTGNYTLSFVFMSLLMFGASVFSLAAALMARRHNKRQQQLLKEKVTQSKNV